MIPTFGSIVQYTLTESDAAAIMQRRNDAKKHIADCTVGNTGFILHVGNDVAAGDTFPLVITRCWSDAQPVNGQVLLDGNDTFWVTDRSQGGNVPQRPEGTPGTWCEFSGKS